MLFHEPGYELAAGEARGRPGGGKGLRQNRGWIRTLKCGSSRRCQIGLRRLEICQEAVLEDIDVVVIDSQPLIFRDIPDIAHFKHIVRAELALNAHLPGFDVGLFDVGIEGEIAGAAERLVGLGNYRLKG